MIKSLIKAQSFKGLNFLLLLLFSCYIMSLFVTPWTAAHQALLSSAMSWSSFKCMAIESVMLPSHIILGHPLLLLSVIPSIRALEKRVKGKEMMSLA